VGTSGNAYARFTTTSSYNRAAGLFWIPEVKATSFTATFEYYALTPFFQFGMGDGITFAWLTDTGVAALGAGAFSGGALGFAPNVTGHAFALDSYRNLSAGDPTSPSFSLLRVDKARGNPGSYDWHVATRGPLGSVYDAWRTVVIKVANGLASASVGTTMLIVDAPVADKAAPILAIGFTASTGGGDPIAFHVDTVQIELTDPTCP
jgi:hypothetical protein